MRKAWIAGLALAVAVASPALARPRGHSVSGWNGGDGDGNGSFAAGTLKGTYVFKAHGFADDGKTGEVAVLGTLTFDGTSAVTGNLVMTRGDNAQFSCSDNFTTGGTYSLTSSSGAPGLYSMQIPVTGGSSTGAINFGLLVPSPDGKSADVIETDNGLFTTLTICGAPGITSMVLRGSLSALDGGEGD